MLLQIILAMLLVCLSYICYKHISKEKINLPGPRGLPFLGNIRSYIRDGGPVWQVQKWAKQYGDIFKVNIMGEDIVVLSDYDSIYEALVTNANDFAGRPFHNSYVMKTWFHHSVSTQDFTPRFKTYKKIGLRGIKQYGDGISRIVKLSNSHIRNTVEEFKAENGKAFDQGDKITNLVFKIIICLILGEGTPVYEEDCKFARRWMEDTEKLNEGPLFYILEFFPWIRHLYTLSGVKILDSVIKQRNKLIDSWIQRFTDQNQDNERDERSLLEELLSAEREGKITHEAIYGIVGDAFSAGIFTTYTTTNGFLIAMMNYPEVQDKLHQEIDKVIGRERQPELSDRENMPYMEAAILETLRFMSMVPMNIPHKTTCDTQIAGCRLPKGTQVWTNLYGLHHDKRYFKGDPNTFDPTRFLDSEGNLIPHEERKAVLAFGAGRRVCMGEVLAKTRLFLFLSQLLQQLHFLPEDPENVIPFDMKSFVTAPMALLAPKFKVVAKVR